MKEEVKLNAGGRMPPVGFGTWQLAEGAETEDSVAAALQAGYRLIDTARIYHNEKSVGRAIRQSGIDRDEIFVTTKLWPRDFGYDSALAAFDASLERLGLDYLDLYLLHWPGGNDRREAWRALEKLFQDGTAKAVGVSNYTVEDLEEMPKYSDLVPAVNQIEFHPFNYEEQRPVLDFCESNEIAVEAYSPLARGRALDNPAIRELAAARHKSPAQVVLRWAVQHGTIPIPKSATPERIKSNLDIFDFELSSAEMMSLNALS